MFHGNHRQFKPDHTSCFTRIIAGAGNHHITGNFTFVGANDPLVVWLLRHCGYFNFRISFRSIRPCAFEQSHGHIHRSDMSVIRMKKRSDEIIDFGKRPEFFNFSRTNHFKWNSNRGSGSAIAFVLIHTFLITCQTQISGFVKTDMLSGFIL